MFDPSASRPAKSSIEAPATPSTAKPSTAMSSDAFAQLGESRVAYVKVIPSELVGFLCAEAPLLGPGRRAFVLHAADGRPMLVTNSLESALADAKNYQLETVSLH
jgi:hypothetical protein